ncbi:MAG: hypothetical protein ACI9MC_000628 [Kiritimatiellia bacterium]|jgi:hypothetical protein
MAIAKQPTTEGSRTPCDSWQRKRYGELDGTNSPQWSAMTPGEAIERFLHTGEHDPAFTAWGTSQSKRGEAVLRHVLNRVLAYRVEHAPILILDAPVDAEQQVRDRIEPMVREFFAPSWADLIIEQLPRRVRILTPDNFATELDLVDLQTAWRMANLLLDDLSMPPLADDTPTLDGLCDGSRAWVTPRAFEPPIAPFTDVIVHEAAHVLHALTGAAIGLPSLEPLIAVKLHQQETFAYACEIWAVVERSDPSARAGIVRDVASGGLPDDARVRHRQLIQVLTEAASGEGWTAVRRAAHQA